jgi:hypothetical protein
VLVAQRRVSAHREAGVGRLLVGGDASADGHDAKMVVTFLYLDYHGNHGLVRVLAGKTHRVRIVEKLDHGQVALSPLHRPRGQQRSGTQLGPGHDGAFLGEEVAPNEHRAHVHLPAQLDVPHDGDAIAIRSTRDSTVALR